MDSDSFDIPWSDVSGANPDVPTTAVEPTPAAPPAPTEPVQPQDPPAGEQPPAAPTEEPKQKDELRIRLHGEDAHFARLRKEGVSAEEAVKIAYGKQEQGSPPAQPPPQNDLKAVEDELATLQPILDAAAEDESLLTPEIRKAQKREAELTAKKAVMEAQQAQETARQQQEQHNQFDQAEQKAWADSQARFPELVVKGSPLNLAVEAEWDAIAQNPNHPLFSLPDAPALIVAKHAVTLGIAPAKPTSAQPPAPPTGPGLQPMPAGTGRTMPQTTLTPAQEAAQFAQTLAAAGDDDWGDVIGKDIFGANKKGQDAGRYVFGP